MNIQYLVIEVGARNYVYDSLTKTSTDYPDEYSGKRELLVIYVKANPINIFQIYEYGLPSGRSQLVCWYRT